MNLTNGDSTVELLERSVIEGAVVAWRDVLHWGPVTQTSSLAELSRLQAEFLYRGIGRPLDEVLEEFSARDRAIDQAPRHIVLWFEHDLYDQLQLLQILAELDRQEAAGRHRDIDLICIGEHPEIADFRGLGQLSPQQLGALFDGRQRLGRSVLADGARVWQAFADSDPRKLMRVATELTAASTGASTGAPTGLRYLPQAIERLLEDYPWSTDGLSRTQRTILELSISQDGDPHRMFLASLQLEAAPYLGDWGFAAEARVLIDASAPLLHQRAEAPERAEAARSVDEFFDHQWELTLLGHQVLAGSDWLDHIRIDRWLGGVHLAPDRYRYEPIERRIIERGAIEREAI